MSKLNLECIAFKAMSRGTLCGYATIKVREMKLAFHEVGIYQKIGKTWAQLPWQPWVRNGEIVRSDNGKARYFPLHAFDSDEVKRAFSRAAVEAVLRYEPRALDCREDVA